MDDVGGFSLEPAPKSAVWHDVASWDEESLPPRPWIAPGYLLRGSVTTIVGPGGVSKSSLVLAYVMVLALNEPLQGFVPRSDFRSFVYNIEDDLTEQRRRLTAIGTRHGRKPSEFAHMIARAGPEAIGMLFARDPDTKEMMPTRAMQELEDLCVLHGTDVLFVDPLAEMHGEDENDNNAMRAVLAAFRTLAKRLNIAVCVIHHTRKGVLTPGDAEASRGAGAIIGASRVVLTVAGMSQDEEKAFGLEVGARRHFFRVDGGKANYSALVNCEWFERQTFILPTSNEPVSVPVPWQPPVDVVSPELRLTIEKMIKQGSPSGPWSPKIENRPRSIKTAFNQAGIKTANGQKDLLATLLHDGFHADKFRDGNRKWVAGIRSTEGEPSGVQWESDEFPEEIA